MSGMRKPLSLWHHIVTAKSTSWNYKKKKKGKKEKRVDSWTIQTKTLLFFQLHSKTPTMVLSCEPVCVLCSNVNHEGSNLEIPLQCACIYVCEEGELN